MNCDEYRDLTRRFLNTTLESNEKKLNEQSRFAVTPEEMGDNNSFSDSLRIEDVDNAEIVITTITAEYDMVTIRFGNSMTIHLSAPDAEALGNILNNAAITLNNDGY